MSLSFVPQPERGGRLRETIWVVQLLLLSPLALLAIDLGGDGYIDGPPVLNQFTPQERVRFVRLHEMVRATRNSHPDADPVPQPPSPPLPSVPRSVGGYWLLWC